MKKNLKVNGPSINGYLIFKIDESETIGYNDAIYWIS